MLSDLFQQETARRAAQAAITQQNRADRDAFIVAQWPLLDKAFSDMVDATVGSDPHLTVTHTTATDSFSNHTFASLNKTITAVKSTLNGAPETVTFTPFLRSVAPDQFGVVSITTDGLPNAITSDPGAQLFADLLKEGILMRGKTAGSLVVLDDGQFTNLTAETLQGFLAALFIRD
ncbi:MAG TPA: hypothetical protein VHN74_17710 [Candidatus Angelobacter sp.]|jgi:hypothetical protein|nr:hypothetical protein [Candidatus Angelobacter sp.]